MKQVTQQDADRALEFLQTKNLIDAGYLKYASIKKSENEYFVYIDFKKLKNVNTVTKPFQEFTQFFKIYIHENNIIIKVTYDFSYLKTSIKTERLTYFYQSADNGLTFTEFE